MTFEAWLQQLHSEIPTRAALAVLSLAEEGATVPFIARYRKEQTGNLDEVGIQTVLDTKEKWELVVHRQKFIIEQIDQQKKLTDELREKILGTFTLELLDDLYLPYKQKRKTKAAIAKEAGLEPLADWIWGCAHGTETPQDGQTLEIWAFTFRNEAAGISDAAAAIEGARNILVERLAEIRELRQTVRDAVLGQGVIKTGKGKKAKAGSKFELYFSHEEAITSLMQPHASHRYMAIRRGWIEEELTLSVSGPTGDPEFEQRLLRTFEASAISMPGSPGHDVLLGAARLALNAHVLPSIENEAHKGLKGVADEVAIQVFAQNVRKLLLASPLGPKAVLGVDPGVRTGCKLAVVDASGKYLASTVMHLRSETDKTAAKGLLGELLKNTQLDAIAVGNGTAGRETESFIRAVIKEAGSQVPVIMVSEAGASVYSASEAAREEFPDLDVTVRGAISIARRLQDPLAELVKIDPKSIGVGQYQHDVSQPALKRSLDLVVDSCVNTIGVNLNTASYHLLAHVSGIGPALAKALVEQRESQGLFKSRRQLEEIPRFSKKAFEQAAGFLRIADGEHPLDNTGVHPERYADLDETAQRLGKRVADLLGPGAEIIKGDAALKERLGEYTFADVVRELERPGRDPRDPFVVFSFRDDIFEVKDLKQGMVCPGIVTNVTNFGAFVDVGVHQDGLVHISQLCDRFIKDPREAVNPGDHVQVRVLEVNLEKNQISFSMKNLAKNPAEKKPRPERRPDRRPERGQDVRATRSNDRGQDVRATRSNDRGQDVRATRSNDRGQDVRATRSNDRGQDVRAPRVHDKRDRRQDPQGGRADTKESARDPSMKLPVPLGSAQGVGHRAVKPKGPPKPVFTNNPFAALASLKKELKPKS